MTDKQQDPKPYQSNSRAISCSKKACADSLIVFFLAQNVPLGGDYTRPNTLLVGVQLSLGDIEDRFIIRKGYICCLINGY